ncbi:MAG: hypothetical protein ACHQ1D_01465 [Nitrososphaerales archaeon]
MFTSVSCLARDKMEEFNKFLECGPDNSTFKARFYRKGNIVIQTHEFHGWHIYPRVGSLIENGLYTKSTEEAIDFMRKYLGGKIRYKRFMEA